MSLYEELGFKVEDGRVKTLETRKDSFGQIVPAGVRPATAQEIAMWNKLEEIELAK